MKNKIPLIELFVSIQGEGRNQGKLCTFLRFKDCNLECSFCDTMNKMNTIPQSFYNIFDIVQLGKKTNNNFVITGGEPTLDKYKNYILDLINLMKYKSLSSVDFETNGFKMNELYIHLKNNLINKKILNKVNFTFSPKYYNLIKDNFYDNYIDDESIDIIFNYIFKKIENLRKNNFNVDKNLILKLVMSDKKVNFSNSIRIIDKIIKSKIIKNKNIYIMPEGTTKEDILTGNKKLFNICFQKKVNFSSRLHILHSFE